MMKRKRIQNEESNDSDKKVRVEEEAAEDVNPALNNSLLENKEFVLTREIADNSILCDISGSQWRIGVPVGAGSFGEIYLASNDTSKPVDFYNANYVTKIEPHSNGPLFVEIHCLMNVNKGNAFEDGEERNEEQEVLGIPKYIASGSHYFNDSRYRFLIMPRYKADLHSIIKSGRLSQKHFLILATQIIDVLQRLHQKNYVHSDIKAQNVMIGQFDSSFSANQPQKPLLNGFKKNVNNRTSIQFSGANPLRTCRIKEDHGSHDRSPHTVYNDMVRSHYLRPGRTIDYALDEVSTSSHQQESETNNDSDDEDFEVARRKKRAGRRSNNNKSKRERKSSKSPLKNNIQQERVAIKTKSAVENNYSYNCDHVYLIDYGLATKFVDTNGEHRPFCMDQRRAHDGTIEFTSRDAHFGAHSRRSDLECFGYNLIYWSQGYLPWKDEKLKDQPEIVHRLKEIFMTDVKEMLKLLYGKDVPKYLGEYMQYVGQLEFDEEPDYDFLKGLFEREFVKLGFNKSEMQLNLNEIREECEPFDRLISEHDLMMANITDLKTVTKLGFLVASTDSVDGNETLVKPKESLSLNLSCKASPKNLRSKEKGTKGKRPKRQRKVLSEKEIVTEKMAKGKKLSIQEIAILDPEQIARERAEKEYEKFDEKVYYQTPQKYKGNPTYAILEIENRLKSKQNGGSAVVPQSVNNSCVASSEIEPIKGYTKPMMDVLKKQQMIVEKQLSIEQNSPLSTYQKRNREGLRNVIKHTQKNITYQNEVNLKKEQHSNKKIRSKRGRPRQAETKSKVNRKMILDNEMDENDLEVIKQVATPKKRKATRRGRPAKRIEMVPQEQDSEEKTLTEMQIESEDVETAPEPEPVQQAVEKKRRGVKRSRTTNKPPQNVIMPAETEEDSVYYDIPGEGSNDGINATSDNDDDDDDDVKPVVKRLRKRDFSTSVEDENSNHSSVSSTRISKRIRDRYYNDEDFEVSCDEASNQTSISHVTKTSAASSFRPKKRPIKNALQENSKLTRNKTKSRSTSRSAAVAHNSDTDISTETEEGSEFELDESADESEGMDFDKEEVSEQDSENEEIASDVSEEVETESELDDDDDDDSIDIKYSPIKTRHARNFNMKQIRGRRMNMLNEDVRNFRLVSTRG